jgi:HAD superfamily hydrolase (TIGR01490 family)
MHLALFDFDNTLTVCDGYSRFLRRVATPQQLSQAKWKIGPWLLAYRAGLISAHHIRKRVTQVAFTGRNAAEIIAHGTVYARETLPATLRPEAMQRLEWHKSQGHEIAVVSGSLDVYLQPWCEQQGVALICNRLEAIEGRLTGRYAGGDVAPYKAREICKRYDLSKYERIHAYGDSREDKPMLALAHERWYAGKRII